MYKTHIRIKRGRRWAAFFNGYGMDEYTNIRTLIEPSVNDLGFDIVRLKWVGGDSLQIMIDQKNGAIITVDDCERVSHTVSAILDVEDVIQREYRLEVSSPGIDRPLTRVRDFEIWQGFDTKLEATEMIEGRKKFRGKVKNVTADDKIEFEQTDEKKIYSIPFAKINEAKLVMNDELVKHVMKTNAERQGVVEGKEIEV